MNRPSLYITSAIVVGAVAGVWLWGSHTPPEMSPLKPRTPQAGRILSGAQSQIGTLYDARYVQIGYPGGDVRPDRGACTDVVVRALRRNKIDLQKLIHEDMKRNFSAYPQLWKLAGPNSNIDHRRVPNQMTFFRRHAQSLPTTVTRSTLRTWLPGDIVYWNTSGSLRQSLHTGIVSNRRNGYGIPFVIHNGSVCIEEDALTRWPIIGHFRYDKAEPFAKGRAAT
jgi:uncharacterized protein YijF (DUF1287 family)